MDEVHHFAHGWFNPAFAYAISFIGSLLGLYCTARARDARPGAIRSRWLVLAAVALGGGGVWLMHSTAMLGFAVVGSPIRYDLTLTVASLVMGVGAVGIGLFVVGYGHPSLTRIVAGGAFTGLGVLAMHYTGMAGMRARGEIDYDPGLVAASALIAVGAATVALWFTVTIHGWRPILAASAIMGLAVCGMHYTGMAAVRFRIDPTAVAPVDGIRPLVLVVWIMVLAGVAMLGLAIVALQAMMQEEYGDDTVLPGRHVSV
jgi:NO-binding membrane sensor protein with MHYT domain